MALPESNYFLLPVSDIQPFVPLLFESTPIGTFLVFIHNLIQTPFQFKNSKRSIVESLAFHYPDLFSLRLTRLLALNPPMHTRVEVISLLQQTIAVTPTQHLHKIHPDTVLQLKPLILQIYKYEIQEALLLPLAVTIGDLADRIDAFPLGGWSELLEYIVSCVTVKWSDNISVLKIRKGLRLLKNLRWNIAKDRAFWNKHYSNICQKLMGHMTDPNADENSKALALTPLCSMLIMSQPLGEYEIGGWILLILLEFMDQHSNEEIVMKRVRDLRCFVSQDVGIVMSGKEEKVFQAMLRIISKIGVTNKLRCAAIDVLKCLWEDRLSLLETLMKRVSDVDAQRILKISMVLMFESEAECFKHGNSLLNWLSCRGEGNFVFHVLMDFFKTAYPASKDLKKRHGVMCVIAEFVENITDGSVLPTELMKMITDEINHVISIMVERGKAKEAGTSEQGSQYLTDEEIIRSSNHSLSVTIKALRGRLSPHAEEIFYTMAQLLGKDYPDNVKEILFSFWNNIGPLFPDECCWNRFHDIYACELLKANEDRLSAQMETAHGIGVCASYGGHKFKPFVNDAISKIYSLLEHGYLIKGEGACCLGCKTETAVTALAMIFEHHWENILGRPEVIRTWLSFLPLKNSVDVAKYVHGILSKMLKREEVDVLGPNNKNLPKIEQILKTILSRCATHTSEETFIEIIEFLDKHCVGM